MTRRLVRNAAECRRCGEVVESRHRHDFRVCRCGLIAVDGGLDYARRAVMEPDGTWDDIIDRCEYADEGKAQP